MYERYEGSRVNQARKIFQRVGKVADKHRKFSKPQLFVFKSVTGATDYWAKALPDGNILLWKAAIDACYKNVQSSEESDARLAFILGHELGHLAHDDYGYLKQRTTSDRKDMELRADKDGYAYASLSSYKVQLLLKNRFHNNNFLTHFLDKTRAHAGYHPVNMSVKALRSYLKKVQSKLVFFDFGLRLSHFDRCDDGRFFLQEFAEIFPAREVLNNLGFCYLQQARQQMERERAHFYWMPQVLDVETQATGVVMAELPLTTLKQHANSSPGKEQGKQALLQAKRVLEKAAQADVSYLPARLNLAVTYLYLGQPVEANVILKEAHRLAPDNLEIQNLQALTRYEQNTQPEQLYKTITQLRGLARQSNVPNSVLFNLARLLEMHTRPPEARQYWKRLALVADRLPNPIRDIVCQHQACRKSTKQQLQSPPWKWEVVTRLNTWGQPLEKKWPLEKNGSYLTTHIYQHPNRQIEVLQMNDEVRMQVIKGDNLGTVDKLEGYCEQPLRQRNLARGILKFCGEWAALAFENQVQEVWRYIEVKW